MIVLIQLDRVEVDCLLPYLWPESDLCKRISLFLGTGGPNHIYCTESESVELLRIAKECCSKAVERIQEGMRLSGINIE